MIDMQKIAEEARRKIKKKLAYGQGINTVWDSGLEVIDATRFEIKVPERLLHICKKLDEMFPHSEFSILSKFDKRDGKTFFVKDEYYIPKQEVTGASVDYKEDTPEWDVVIHKHPGGMRGFSGTDQEFINANNVVSILFCQGEFVCATANIWLDEDTKIRVPISRLNIEIERDYDIEVEGTYNIKKVKPKRQQYIPISEFPGMGYEQPTDDEPAIDKQYFTKEVTDQELEDMGFKKGENGVWDFEEKQGDDTE